MKIVWTELARQDLREIFIYIAEENPKAAKVLLSKIKHRVAVQENNPEMGRTGRVEGIGELVLSGMQYIFPYREKISKFKFCRYFMRLGNGQVALRNTLNNWIIKRK